MELIVFLSPGRCGTQFFATYLRDAAADRAVVRHEPLRAQYAPKLTLRAPDLDRLLPSYPPVQRHFEKITRIIEAGRVYVETGWPVFSWIPWFLERFGDQALAVHLTRNPMRFAFSLASHGFFSPELRLARASANGAPVLPDLYPQLAELHPNDPGVKHHDYAEQWDSLNPVEKSLFQWLEVNTWAEELKAAHPDRFVTFRAEDALAQPEILSDGIIARRPRLADVFRDRPAPPGVVDKYRMTGLTLEAGRVNERTLGFDVDSLRYSPAVAQLATQYGYSMDVEEVGIARRFLVDDLG